MSKFIEYFANSTRSLRIQIQSVSPKNKIIYILLFFLSVGIISATVFAYQVKKNIDKMMIPETRMTETTGQKNDQYETDDGIRQENNNHFYVLVMGMDYREGHHSLLTDLLMVFHVIPEESVIKLLSIPRDLIVENSRGYLDKMNTLFYEGYLLYQEMAEQDPSMLTGNTVELGSRKMDKIVLSGAMSHTRNKIEELLDIDIEHMVLVDFQALVSLVDEVGGIEIEVKRSMRYKETNLYLEPGLRVLNGEEALAFVRYRQDDRGQRYYISDFERAKNQQEVVKKLADKILSWRNITKSLGLLDILSDNLKTDMNYSDMYTMITKYYDVFDGNSFVSIPFPEHYNSKKEVIIPEDSLENLRNTFNSINSINSINDGK
jgi:cell envelope-related function transcriptional attenuator common domain